MKSKIKGAIFWAGVLLCALVAVNVWPARVALGPQGVLEEWPEDREGPGDWPDVTRVVDCGCTIQSPVMMHGQTGWRVVVWADYSKKEKGQAHDWEQWLSFRAGKPGDKKANKKASGKAHQDCQEWTAALVERVEKVNAEKQKRGKP